MVALRCLVTHWDGGVVSSASERGAVAMSTSHQDGRGCGVAVAYWWLGDGTADEGEGDL